jgi:integrase/recombinase XerD
MKNNGSSERHQNNNLIVMIEFSNYFGSNPSFYDINKKEQILSFLETKIKDSSKDPEKDQNIIMILVNSLERYY